MLEECQRRSVRLEVRVVEEPRKGVEGAIVQALRLGDVKKALRLLVSAPLADKGPETVEALRKLHPFGSEPEPVPASPAPHWSAEVVGPALCSFGPGSAAGLFGYPFHLQQCYTAVLFSRTLLAAVNQLSNGSAPGFLRPFLAGGVSIALRKGVGGVRPLCCGDPLRRLVSKCFCLGGKDEIAAYLGVLVGSRLLLIPFGM